MKGYIAFCPHFHQPHFQLYKTREESYKYSYQPWLHLFSEAAKLENFYINLHFSGPFLYWIKEEKYQFIDEFRSLLGSGKFGIIGGLADEPFVQLSSRNDDYYYQLKAYDKLCYELTGIRAPEWEGIHLVERECGEHLLQGVTRAAGLLKAPPVYYLDAETFYRPHYANPGGPDDYCARHFGFKDQFSKTTVAHLPEQLMYFALRDEIGGEVFYSLPVHSQYRYQLLKRSAFSAEDNIRIKPGQYLFYIKDALEEAAKYVSSIGKEITPLLLIFEDAEKFGQWSKDPEGDAAWLMEFFNLVEKDEELEFTGLKKYLEQNTYLDTYPVYSSHSYPEWENWTARRGIRGVAFGDERLRKVISRLRITEEKQEKFEKMVLASSRKNLQDELPDKIKSILKRAVLQSSERYELIYSLLEKGWADEYQEDYALLNRIRNLVYQEDPKWASRHPCYGAAPYYDMQGLSYLEIGERLLNQTLLSMQDNSLNLNNTMIKDWDVDGNDEVLVQNSCQTVSIDTEGACIDYHHIISSEISNKSDMMRSILKGDIAEPKPYNGIYRYSIPLVLTETDSKLKREFYIEGGRKEICRNSLRANLVYTDGEKYETLGDLAREKYEIAELVDDQEESRILLRCKNLINIGNNRVCELIIEKLFTIKEQEILVAITANINGCEDSNIFLVPEIVSSATPSDEVDFCPTAFLGFNEEAGGVKVFFEDLICKMGEKLSYANRDISVANIGKIDYLYKICSVSGTSFNNLISYQIDAPEIKKVEIKPAVKNYYKDLVDDEQSRLGYNSSGLMILPFVPFKQGEAVFKLHMSWDFDSSLCEDDYAQVVKLIQN